MTDKEFKNIFPLEKPRRLQRKLIEIIIESYNKGYRHVAINAPTGIGKSIVAVAVSNWFLEHQDVDDPVFSSYILTSQKMLQEQYVDDFAIPTVKGRANYKCTYVGGKTTCDAGTCLKNKWKKNERLRNCPHCPYYTARHKVYNSPISILNYAYFLNMGFMNPGDIQTKRKLLVFDEGHGVPDELISFSSVIMSKKELTHHNLMHALLNFPEEDDPEETKFDWLLKEILPDLVDEYKKEEVFLDGLSTSDSDYNTIFKKVKYLSDLLCKISNVREEYLAGRPCAVIQNKKMSITFKPIFGKDLANKYLYPFSDLTLSMSATILSKEQFCREMGLTKEEVMFINLPSLFPPKNRPIYSCNIGSMAWKNKDKTKPKLLKAVEGILEQHKNERGIIHTVNYETAEYLINNISTNRLIMPRGKTRDKEIKYFMESTSENLVLISPSLQEGIDLKDDLSRFSILCKLPFASLMDPWVQKRKNLSPNWYSEKTIQSVVQASGRSVRSETDKAVCYILDSDFTWFFDRNKNKFPKWWQESLILK